MRTSPSARAGGTTPPKGSSSSELRAKAAAVWAAGRSAGAIELRRISCEIGVMSCKVPYRAWGSRGAIGGAEASRETTLNSLSPAPQFFTGSRP